MNGEWLFLIGLVIIGLSILLLVYSSRVNIVVGPTGPKGDTGATGPSGITAPIDVANLGIPTTIAETSKGGIVIPFSQSEVYSRAAPTDSRIIPFSNTGSIVGPQNYELSTSDNSIIIRQTGYHYLSLSSAYRSKVEPLEAGAIYGTFQMSARLDTSIIYTLDVTFTSALESLTYRPPILSTAAGGVYFFARSGQRLSILFRRNDSAPAFPPENTVEGNNEFAFIRIFGGLLSMNYLSPA